MTGIRSPTWKPWPRGTNNAWRMLTCVRVHKVPTGLPRGSVTRLEERVAWVRDLCGKISRGVIPRMEHGNGQWRSLGLGDGELAVYEALLGPARFETRAALARSVGMKDDQVAAALGRLLELGFVHPAQAA